MSATSTSDGMGGRVALRQEHPAIDHLRSILPEITREAIRAHAKHGTRSLLEPENADGRLAHLVEEVGEVARPLSELAQLEGDESTGAFVTRLHLRAGLRTELVQLAHVALAWAACLDLEEV